MTGQTYKALSQKSYTAGRLLGTGGEGAVFEVREEPQHVIKIYSSPVDADKAAKLVYMAAARNPVLDKFAAWPVDVVVDTSQAVVGFVMKRLAGFFPLHMLFSPMDRKKIFPDKGYNFLIHVARNLAGAFMTLHQGQIIVGDVNEGNILVDLEGRVNFIDCDSFQVKNGDHYHYCEVGVPRYTPPELLNLGSFENVVRTVNTDCFSMSVLIFQLLFLGRHPFAGINASREDIDEETAIRKKYFAYTLADGSRKLLPPKDSFKMEFLPLPLADLFERSFTREERPKADQWLEQLGAAAKDIVLCKKSKVHSYPDSLTDCPWCFFKEQRGIVYFLDDNFVAIGKNLNNLEEFVNGFKVERLNLPVLTSPPGAGKASLVPKEIPKRYKTYKVVSKIMNLVIAGATVYLLTVDAGLVYRGVLAFIINIYILPWSAAIRRQRWRMEREMKQVSEKYQGLVKEFQDEREVSLYNASLAKFSGLLTHVRSLPAEFQQNKTGLEERLYGEQLAVFLVDFDIRNYPIPSFGPTRKLALYQQGIRNAADISKLGTIKIQGIGPKYEQILHSWQRQMAGSFMYKPDNLRLEYELKRIWQEILSKANSLQVEVRNQHQNLESLRVKIQNKKQALKAEIAAMEPEVFQQQVDVAAFKKFARVV